MWLTPWQVLGRALNKTYKHVAAYGTTHTHTHTHTHTRSRTHTYMYAHTCIHKHTYTVKALHLLLRNENDRSAEGELVTHPSNLTCRNWWSSWTLCDSFCMFFKWSFCNCTLFFSRVTRPYYHTHSGGEEGPTSLFFLSNISIGYSIKTCLG